jgi:hypothetical protein
MSRRGRAGGQDTGHGIFCRADQSLQNGNYAFIIWDLRDSNPYVSIGKYFDQAPWYRELVTEPIPAVDVKAVNRLQAVCTSNEGQQAVRLGFWVNGEKVAETTDTKPWPWSANPFQTGTVGLLVAFGPEATAVEAEFDNFAVTEL